MKAITVCQPHAFAICHGPKRFENRTWAPKYRGPLLIHAGVSRKWMRHVAWYRRHGVLVPDVLPFGALVGICWLADVVKPGGDRYATGPRCLVLRDVLAFTHPLACRGMLSLWDYHGDLPHEAVKWLDAHNFGKKFPRKEGRRR